ncbi:hypothetical protein BD310DRAFT_813138 [Dichomitus squalens]|uniref:Ribosomal RNA methyltransferase FtsJ domain-containing protein n=1 Tax=Dichomitus squalens TaxID=114155 RepID=A0A4Q9Q2Q0_9APHY|nr:hypothetical protein BD310DRAFT_813138 [Dichomitus squalens]
MLRTLEYEYTPHTVDNRPTAAAALLERRHVQVLADLNELKRKGWSEESLHGHFSRQRNIADRPNHQTEKFWFGMMKKGMEELDAATGILSSNHRGQLHFLDVCCAPGGFSSYVLGRKPLARGVGISLPVSSGGHGFKLEPYFRSRYDLIEKDILEYDHALHDLSDSPARFPETMAQRFDLVIVDGHALRTYLAPFPYEPSADDLESAHHSYRGRLIISQLIIALEAVRPGGTIVMRLSHIESFPATPILYLLDMLSDTLVVHKPRSMHAYRATFYVVAKGVAPARVAGQQAHYLAGLRRLWAELSCGGSSGRGRQMVHGDLDFIVTTSQILDSYVDRLVELGREVWQTQLDALRTFLERKGIR